MIFLHIANQEIFTANIVGTYYFFSLVTDANTNKYTGTFVYNHKFIGVKTVERQQRIKWLIKNLDTKQDLDVYELMAAVKEVTPITTTKKRRM